MNGPIEAPRLIADEHQIVGARRRGENGGTPGAKEDHRAQRPFRGRGNLLQQFDSARVKNAVVVLSRVQCEPSARIFASSRIMV